MSKLRDLDRAEREMALRAFSARLCRLRTEAGYSQEQLTTRCGLHHGELSKVEGGTREPGLIKILVLADGLDISPGRLLDGLPLVTHTAARAHAVAIIREQPGITTAELAGRLEVTQGYVYRLLPRALEEGHVTRETAIWRSGTQNS
jgi:transcriptional regulator with XRE-family HTH domain